MNANCTCIHTPEVDAGQTLHASYCLAAAVAAQGALPVPVEVKPLAPQGRPRTMLDRARDAVNARMTKDDLRLVLENVISYAADLEAEREKLVRWHGEDSATINRLAARAELALCADCGHVEGAHSKDGETDCTASGARVRKCNCSFFIPGGAS